MKAETSAARRLMIKELNRTMVRGRTRYCASCRKCRKPEATSHQASEAEPEGTTYVSSAELRKSSNTPSSKVLIRTQQLDCS